ncbi:hypothetical protein [Geodermatophilus pulveris]|uniref:hypothetical protein n=1 Tax=Geodermatophilus pulveris TaxID=1564159 RepID=UPI00117A7530|nr:hypothetical protein [Geodermatophilus pulveris]
MSPTEALEVTLDGVGQLTAPAGTFATPGTVTVTPSADAPPPTDGLTPAGSGIDVTFDGTQPATPLRLVLTDVAAARGPDDIPVVQHQRHDGTWETLPAEVTADGHIVVETTEFSPQWPAWLNPVNWVRSLADATTDALLSRTDALACADNGPGFAMMRPATTLLHSCLITNTDSDSGRDRAEVQLTPNRRFYVWISVPDGVEYTWLETQPAALRAALGQVFGFDSDRQVLVDSGTLFTAGAGQPGLDRTLTFTSYTDGKSAALSLGAGLTGLLGLEPRQGLLAVTYLSVQCADKIPASIDDAGGMADFAVCFAQAALSALEDPDRAFAGALNLFGEDAYAREAEAALERTSKTLRLLGKALAVAGAAGAVRDIWTQLPDAFSQNGVDRPGDVHLDLAGRGPVTDVTVGLDGIGPVPWGTPVPAAEEALGARFDVSEDNGLGCAQATLPQFPGLTFGLQDGQVAVAAYGGGDAPATDTGVTLGGDVAEVEAAYPGAVVDADPSDAFTTRYTASSGGHAAQFLSFDQATVDYMQFGLAAAVGEAPCV